MDRLKSLLGYSLALFLAIVAYRPIANFLGELGYPLAAVVSMLFLPIFCYFIQMHLWKQSEGKANPWIVMGISFLMIILSSVLVATFSFLASKYTWLLFISEPHPNPDTLNWVGIVYNHVTWYALFGLPSVLIARGVLWMKLRKT